MSAFLVPTSIVNLLRDLVSTHFTPEVHAAFTAAVDWNTPHESYDGTDQRELTVTPTVLMIVRTLIDSPSSVPRPGSTPNSYEYLAAQIETWALSVAVPGDDATINPRTLDESKRV